ncbi:MAG: PadR family transcriptional regulator [Chloroflexota bacterium]
MTNRPSANQSPNMLGYAILELLERVSLSGYDLKKRFASSLAFGWHAHDSQIYPQLKQLERTGYIQSQLENSSAGPARRVYSLTSVGRAHLVEWLQSPLDDTRQKSELMLRVWSSDLMPPEAFTEMLVSVERQTQDRLRTLQVIRKRMQKRFGAPEIATDPQQVGVLLCLEHDIQLAQAQLNWIERATSVARTRQVFQEAAQGRATEAMDKVSEPENIVDPQLVDGSSVWGTCDDSLDT